MCAVADSVNINQLPSATAYGNYSGVLVSSLSPFDVLELHKRGINSVYSTSRGPNIFGIKSLHERQISYFGKANISRVISSILKNVLKATKAVIHTPTASDPIARSAFEIQLNNILANYITSRDIDPISIASVSAELNRDSVTMGGEILYIELIIRFYKLVESVNIKVIATDSSVAVEV